MRYIFLLISMILSNSAISIPLEEAISKKLLNIQVNGTSLGSINKSLRIQLRNTSTIAYTLEVSIGSIFQAKEDKYQDMVTTEPLLVKLEPGATVEDSLYAFCIQPDEMSPNCQVQFNFREIAKGKLMDIVKFVHHQKLFDGAGSALVWNVINGSDIFYGCDIAEHNFNGLKKFFSQHSKFQFKDCSEIPPNAQQIYALESNEIYSEPIVHSRPLITFATVFQLQFAKESDMEISLFDDRGNVIKQFAKNRISKGHYDYQFEFTNSTLQEGKSYEIRLIVDGIVRTKRLVKA